MSNKTQLQTNNTALDGYIARINAAKEVTANLPEAGGSGGGSVEAYTVTFVNEAPMSPDITVWYTNPNMGAGTTNMAVASQATIEVAKNSIIAIQGTSCAGLKGCEYVVTALGCYIYRIVSSNAYVELY